ncbi:protein ROOT PRIMORDIUM DEFECTIVE 1 [Tripterygium wilfordii]|uniref:Protein ROOT PRIMORDIUM DEFECTIVE 1 n=1 Tax=Tripterygium wilfordii TaxID=458696 RepID=A0A7J7CZA7_TRIWF|nr:protein WHAT'S THIS FACTOR 1, chloroplastic [Tripterygium wilfordii]KAF5739424.1 protein ROOT PRIMORDIUM DEFECTIVE 1 [Tripterygium wilfordii]
MYPSLSVSSQKGCFPSSTFLQPTFPPWKRRTLLRTCPISNNKQPRNLSFAISCSAPKIVRSPSLDRHVVKQNRIRFVQKLKTLLLSKPKHYIHLRILSKCRAYLNLERPRSILSMIHRYPSIFEVFNMPLPPTPLNATKSGYQLCVRLTPAAAALATQELNLKSAISINLATKLQKLLMLSSHHRLVLSKLVHLAPDLGLPPNFRSRLCNDHPDRFKIVDTSYGRALELVGWEPELAMTMPIPDVKSLGFIVDRPLKFKHLKLRKGLNVKRRHRDFLIKFQELPDICPFSTSLEEFAKESIQAEKRACGVVREVLGMTVEKRTLIDHLTHFRNEFGLPNKLRGMILRHPELFYVSLKGQRDSVFLVEGYDDKGVILEKDVTSVIKDQWMQLVSKSKWMRRERRNSSMYNNVGNSDDVANADEVDDYGDDYDDGFETLFDSDESDLHFDFDNDDDPSAGTWDHGEFWTVDGSSILASEGQGSMEPW